VQLDWPKYQDLKEHIFQRYRPLVRKIGLQILSERGFLPSHKLRTEIHFTFDPDIKTSKGSLKVKI